MEDFGYKKHKRHYLLFVFALSIILAAAVTLALIQREPDSYPVFGITFSTEYADSLGIDAKQAFTASLTDLGAKHIRFPFYWSDIEREEGVYNWSEMDWFIEEAEKHNAKLTIALGAKVPRWPECFIPDWAERLDIPYRHDALLAYIEEAVNRYKHSPAITRWQVENEAFFPFGECPRPSLSRYLEEVELVRSLDSRPVQATVSGELEPWFDAAVTADILGISMYRVTWNDFFGFFYYPVTPGFYRSRAASVRPLVERIIISELQAEPWFPEPIDTRSLEEWYEIFDEEDMKRNVDFSVRTGLDEVFLWGAEWWYLLKENQLPGLWNYGKEVLSRNR